jgi:hypothetical protein
MRHGISRNNRFLVAIAGMTALAILLVGFAYAFTESERLDIAHDSQTTSDLWAASSRLAGDVNAQESAIDDYLFSADPQAMSRFEAAVTDEAAVTALMRAGAVELPGLRSAITEIESATATWRSSFARPAIAAVEAGGGTALAPFTRGSSPDEEPVNAALAELTVQLNLADGDLRLRDNALSVTRTEATLFSLGVLVLSAVFSLWLIRRFSRTLQKDSLRNGILNQFTEAISFAADDTAVAKANLEALALLVHPDAGVTHVLNTRLPSCGPCGSGFPSSLSRGCPNSAARTRRLARLSTSSWRRCGRFSCTLTIAEITFSRSPQRRDGLGVAAPASQP